MGNTRDAHSLGTSPGCPAATQRTAAAKLEKLFRHCQASQHQREQALVADLLRSTTAPGSPAEQRLREQLREPTVNFEAFVAALDTEDAFVRRLFTHIYHNVQTQALLDATVRASSSSSESASNVGNAASAVESSTAGTQSRNPFMSILRRFRNRSTPLSSVLSGGVDTLPYGGSLFDQLSREATIDGGGDIAQDMDEDEDGGGAGGYNAYGYDDDDDSGSDDDGSRGVDRSSPWYIPNSNSARYYSTTPSDAYSSYHAPTLASASASRLVARDFMDRPMPSSSSSSPAAATPSTASGTAEDTQIPTASRASDAVLASRPRFVRRLSLGLVSLPSSFTSTTQPPSSSSSASSSTALPTAATTISPWALLRSSSSTSTPPPTLASSSPAAAPPATSVSNASSRRSSLSLTMPPAPAPTTASASSSSAFQFALPSITPTPSARDTANPFTSLFSSSSSAAAAPSTPVSETPGFAFGSAGRSSMPSPRAARDHRDRPSYASSSSPPTSSAEMEPSSSSSASTSASIAHQFARSIRIRAASLFGSSSSSLSGASASADERRRDPPSSSGGGAAPASGST